MFFPPANAYHRIASIVKTVTLPITFAVTVLLHFTSITVDVCLPVPKVNTVAIQLISAPLAWRTAFRVQVPLIAPNVPQAASLFRAPFLAKTKALSILDRLAICQALPRISLKSWQRFMSPLVLGLSLLVLLQALMGQCMSASSCTF